MLVENVHLPATRETYSVIVHTCMVNNYMSDDIFRQQQLDHSGTNVDNEDVAVVLWAHGSVVYM